MELDEQTRARAHELCELDSCPVLDALLVDEDDDGVIGPVDFRSLLYGLDETDVRVVFETFHEGWDYR